MEDVKVKISILWIFKALASLTFTIIMFMEEGVLAGIMAGELLGMQIGPEILLLGTIESWVPLVMAVLSINLEYRANRWANIIAGIVFTALGLISLIDAFSAHGILMWVSAAVATALIAWLALKWPEQKV
ncbi:MAG: hypothetical protein JSV58_05435 [Candidatus Bathyarchaeota archaeon]|nr:MAG: hypothetical protein JSV58_05435 [Candidatus Bathyarchaeota archaeon]